MKNPVLVRSSALLCIGVLGLTWVGKVAATTLIQPEEVHQKSRWVQEHLLDARSSQPPFSFVYDGQAFDPQLRTWSKKAQTQRLDGTRVQYTFTWKDSRTGLEVRCVAVDYADFPVVEWTAYFKNTGKNNTPILQDIQGLDATFQGSAKREFVLQGNKGDCCTMDNYQPYQYALGPGTAKHFARRRPTDQRPQWLALLPCAVSGWRLAPGRGVARPVGHGLRPRRQKQFEDQGRPRVDTSVAESRRGDPHAPDCPAVLAGKRHDPGAEPLATVVHGVQYPQAPRETA